MIRVPLVAYHSIPASQSGADFSAKNVTRDYDFFAIGGNSREGLHRH